MPIVEICKKNALKYSELVCKKLCEGSNILPIYFDWADHIGVSEFNDYPYHLNKIVDDVQIVSEIFRPHIPEVQFQSWLDNWLKPTLGAAWIHDIGMIEDRDTHGLKSAEFLFANEFGFDFSGIELEDKIKIAILCVKHNNAWSDVVRLSIDLLEKNKPSEDYIKKYCNYSAKKTRIESFFY